MLIRQDKNRVYCECDRCKKPFSFKRGSLKAAVFSTDICPTCVLGKTQKKS